MEWQKSFGGSLGDLAAFVKPTLEGGYIITGYTISNDFDVSGHHYLEDFWIVKIDSVANIEWQKCLGGSNSDHGGNVLLTNDSCFVIAGFSQSNDGDVSGNHLDTSGYPTIDVWLVKIDNIGNVRWQKSFGGSGIDYGGSMLQTNNNEYVIAGGSTSNDGDVSGNHGCPPPYGYNCQDYWIVKLYPDTTTGITTLPSTIFKIQTIPNPFTNELTVSIPKLNTETQLTLQDVYGKQVLTQHIPTKTLNLKLQTLNLAKGVYFLQLQNGNQSVTRKLIKM